ncbi:hypothetical protein [Geobacillus sp. B4113_201601]|uniref:hypothetical protein n=1 Tax=Geobacillus sp. B4113_201601 TaxID=1586290 RepID=UPI0013653079|nr:hypothetical protein [Geobacillus sp. B4113_201601]
MANVIRMTMTTARRKQIFVDVVVWDFGVRKRKILNKWRMVDDENFKRLDCSLP